MPAPIIGALLSRVFGGAAVRAGASVMPGLGATAAEGATAAATKFDPTKMMGATLEQVQAAKASNQAKEQEREASEEAMNAQEAQSAAMRQATIAITSLGVATPIAITKFVGTLAEGQKGLAQYNAQVASAVAVSEAQSRMSQIRVAARTAGTSQSLLEANTEMNKSLEDIRVAMANVLNVLGTIAAHSVTIASKGSDAAMWLAKQNPLLAYNVYALEWLVDWFGKDNPEASTGLQFLQDVADRKFNGASVQPLSADEMTDFRVRRTKRDAF